jgi:signal transduction histidine kinase
MLSPEDSARLRKLTHDLNNTFAPIVMAGDLLRASVTDPRAARLLETLRISAQQGAGLVREIQMLIQEPPAAGNAPGDAGPPP